MGGAWSLDTNLYGDSDTVGYGSDTEVVAAGYCSDSAI